MPSSRRLRKQTEILLANHLHSFGFYSNSVGLQARRLEGKPPYANITVETRFIASLYANNHYPFNDLDEMNRRHYDKYPESTQ